MNGAISLDSALTALFLNASAGLPCLFASGGHWWIGWCEHRGYYWDYWCCDTCEGWEYDQDLTVEDLRKRFSNQNEWFPVEAI